MPFVCKRVPLDRVRAHQRGQHQLIVTASSGEVIRVELTQSSPSRATILVDAPSTCRIQRGEALRDADVPSVS